jgi:hypothetical protein
VLSGGNAGLNDGKTTMGKAFKETLDAITGFRLKSGQNSEMVGSRGLMQMAFTPVRQEQ